MDAGPDAAQRERDSRGQAAAADRNDHRAEVVDLVRELEPDRPLAGDHDGILERMDERRSGLRGVLERLAHRVLEGVAGELDRGAVVAGRVHLRHRRLRRHEDGRLDAFLARRPRDGLAVVARARGHDSGSSLGLAQALHLVDGAADLERARALEVLRLQEDGSPRPARERLRAVHRGDADALAREPLARGLDVSECGCGLRRHPIAPVPD